MYFTPKHPIIIYTIAILNNGIQNGLCIGKKVYWLRWMKSSKVTPSDTSTQQPLFRLGVKHFQRVLFLL